jgi:hypothetical protein
MCTYSVLFSYVCAPTCHAEETLFELSALRVCRFYSLEFFKPVLLHPCAGQSQSGSHH